jgi:RNA polymerase sigma-70 factor, ECF subfamily
MMRDAAGALDRTLQPCLPAQGDPELSQAPLLTAASLDGAAYEADDAAARVARLYRELFPAVFGFIRFRVGDVQLAEDLTAMVFERALAKIVGVREPDRVRGWLFTIARNAVTDERRRRRPLAQLDAADALEHLWVDSPDRQALDRDEWRRLARYLTELDDRDREILGLRFAAGLANREVAEIVRLGESNVAQIVHRAVVKVRRRFAAEERIR